MFHVKHTTKICDSDFCPMFPEGSTCDKQANPNHLDEFRNSDDELNTPLFLDDV